jgi:hypothetical protein
MVAPAGIEPARLLRSADFKTDYRQYTEIRGATIRPS